MDERIDIFFILLEESYKIEAMERLEDISIIQVPHMKKNDARSIIDGYRNRLIDPLDYIAENNDYSGLKRLKANLN